MHNLGAGRDYKASTGITYHEAEKQAVVPQQYPLQNPPPRSRRTSCCTTSFTTAMTNAFLTRRQEDKLLHHLIHHRNTYCVPHQEAGGKAVAPPQ
eukprot:822184-Pelagomonas_calceolata.AAC.5